MTFTKWLDTLITEKGIDLEQMFEVEGPSGLNVMPYQAVVEAIKMTGADEQKSIKMTLIKIDFHNGDICHFFRHIAPAIAL